MRGVERALKGVKGVKGATIRRRPGARVDAGLAGIRVDVDGFIPHPTLNLRNNRLNVNFKIA
jgi:hypothetical protein